MDYDIISFGCLSQDIVYSLPFFPVTNSECLIKERVRYHGGAAANFACYASFYGDLKVGLVSKTGDDNEGKELIKRIKVYDVCTNGITIDKNLESTEILTLKTPDGNRKFLVYLGALQTLSLEDIPLDYISNSKLFYIAPINAKIHEMLIELAYKNIKLIAFNPGSVYVEQESINSLIPLIKKVDFLFVNEHEALKYSNAPDIKSAGFKLCSLGAKKVIITQGKAGCSVFYANDFKFYDGYTVQKLDTVGAGDAFAAGFISNFLKTGKIESAAKAGNLFGAYRVKSQEMCKPNPAKKDFIEFSQQISLN
jgi:sugar/nucleoside kinase (ribokinase family)